VNVGLLPALGGSIASLRASGQDSRLVDGYLRPYAQAFERVTYFSYAREALADYTDDPAVLGTVEVRSPRRPVPRLLRALTLPAAERAALRSCAALRVFQLTGVIPALAARALWGVPFVTTYGFWYARLSRPGPSRLAKRVLERVGLRLAAAVIVPTPELRDHAARFARGADRVHLIPNGVDVTRFAPPSDVDRPSHPGPRRILYIGRLEAEKNLDLLVGAAGRLRDRVPLALTFVGAGSQESRLRSRSASLGVAAEFAGVVDHRRLPERLGNADAFVLPSFTEGHPKALIEAMAAGLPCVASDCAGNRALIDDGDTGLLFDPRREDDLAACLERVLTDRALAAGLGRRARDRAVKELDLTALVQREIALVRRVAVEHG
jgi:glycosyltransferase involved in cell wall biosynthesis